MNTEIDTRKGKKKSKNHSKDSIESSFVFYKGDVGKYDGCLGSATGKSIREKTQ